MVSHVLVFVACQSVPFMILNISEKFNKYWQVQNPEKPGKPPEKPGKTPIFMLLENQNIPPYSSILENQQSPPY